METSTLEQMQSKDLVTIREDTVRLDGKTVKDVSDAYEALLKAGLCDGVQRNSPLNMNGHPRSATALDVRTTDLAGVRAHIANLGLDVSADHPPAEEEVNVWEAL